MTLDLHVTDKTLSVNTMMIMWNKYKQQTVIQRNENHRPNTVYSKGIGLPIKKYTLLYSKLSSNTFSWKNGITK